MILVVHVAVGFTVLCASVSWNVLCATDTACLERYEANESAKNIPLYPRSSRRSRAMHSEVEHWVCLEKVPEQSQFNKLGTHNELQ